MPQMHPATGRTITKTVYTFDELSDQAKETARDWYRQVKSEWWTPDDMESVLEDAERMGAILGITMERRQWTNSSGSKGSSLELTYDLSGRYGQTVGFSGSYSYAKGAAKAIRAEAPTDTTLHRIADDLQAIQRRYFYGLTARIAAGRDPGITVYVADSSGDDVDSDSRAREAESCIEDFAAWIYKQFEAENEYQYSDEVIDEDIEANEYTFDTDGRRDD